MLFPSSYDPERLTTLKAYVERMPAEQTEIFYLTGESRRVVENSPHLETFKAKGYEVLYLVDPVDELVVQSCNEFEGKKLQSVGKGAVQLGSQEEKAQAEKALQEQMKLASRRAAAAEACADTSNDGAVERQREARTPGITAQ